MFFDTSPTSFDVRFRLFGIPIRIHPSFWLVMLLILMDLVRMNLVIALLVFACLFLSLLGHELGHSLMYRRYGIYSSIVLHSFGGMATPDYNPGRYQRRIAVSMAGPLVNFAILGIVWGSNAIEPWSDQSIYTTIAYYFLIQVNLFIGVLNSLPIWPLDGGQVSQELWQRVRPRDGLVYCLRLSFLLAILVCFYSLNNTFGWIPELVGIIFGLRPGLIGGIIFGLIAVRNYQMLQMISRQYGYRRDEY